MDLRKEVGIGKTWKRTVAEGQVEEDWDFPLYISIGGESKLV